MKAQVKKADSGNACFVFLAAHEKPKVNWTKSLHVHVVSGHSCIQLKPPFGSNCIILQNLKMRWDLELNPLV